MGEKRKVSVLIPYCQSDGEVFVFLQKRDKDAKRLPDFFGFFGGGIESGESSEEAMKREAKEELNIDVSDYKYFNHYEFYGSILEVFTMLVDKNFSDTVKILEGQYGKFFRENDVINESKLSHNDKLVLHNFFGAIKRNSYH